MKLVFKQDPDEFYSQLDQALSTFHLQARLIIAAGDEVALRELFVKTTASVQVKFPLRKEEVREAMIAALRQVIKAPSNNIPRNWFEDI